MNLINILVPLLICIKVLRCATVGGTWILKQHGVVGFGRKKAANEFVRLLVKSRDRLLNKVSASIATIYKKGKKSDPGHFRLVSLTSVISKTMESFLGDAIVDHLMGNNETTY